MKKIVFLLTVLYGANALALKANDVMQHYADLAEAMYSDSLTSAKTMQESISNLLQEPGEVNLVRAKESWVAARHPYQQTEAYRFGNKIVDDWEGKVNAWPLDEGLIDYVDPAYGSESEENPLYVANVIANKKITLAGKEIDTSNITKELLADTLHEAGEVEANVATGYHAIEFLLWGQDLNGTGKGAGARKASDYDTKNCTNGNCERRAQYLKAVTELLIDDLSWMVKQWQADGAARKAVTAGDANKNLAIIFTGMGSLSYGEQAGERMKLGLLLHDPEEEHDCFSDNTHWSHYNDALSVKNVYTGTYTRIDGTRVKGPSLSELVASKNAKVDEELRNSLDTTMMKMQAIVDSAQNGMAYDQLIGENNKDGNAIVLAAINALVDQTKDIEKAVSTMGLQAITFEGSDSLDAPKKALAQ